MDFFTCVAEKLFHIKQLEGEKFTMETLIREIPEMQTSSLFQEKILNHAHSYWQWLSSTFKSILD